MLPIVPLSHFASWAMARVRRGHRVGVTLGRIPGPRPNWPWRAPELDVRTSPSSVTVSSRVPGATPENTLVTWDEEANCLSLRVARAVLGGPDHDFYAEVVLPITVDGTKAECRLESGTLEVRAPQVDTPGVSGLFLRLMLEPRLETCALA